MLIQDHPFFQSKNATSPDVSEHIRKQEQINALKNPQTLESFSQILSQSTYLDEQAQAQKSHANMVSGKLDASFFPKNTNSTYPQNLADLSQKSSLAQINSLPSEETHSAATTKGTKIQAIEEEKSLFEKIKGFFGQNNDEASKQVLQNTSIINQELTQVSQNSDPKGISLQREGIEILDKKPIGIRPVAIALDTQSLNTLSRLSRQAANASEVSAKLNNSIELKPEEAIVLNTTVSPKITEEKVDNTAKESEKTVIKNEQINTEKTQEELLKADIAKQEILKENNLGALSAKYESGSRGIEAIGYDRVGGTSYGKYQIASNVGTFDRFVSFLSKEAPDIADKLKEGGNPNTGSKSGTMPTIWKEIAKAEPERFQNLQEGFIKHSHFDPAMSSLVGSELNTDSEVLQQVVWSTSVHHGPTGAKRIFDKALAALQSSDKESSDKNLEISEKDFIAKVYDLRANQFSSSTANVREAVQNRLIHEKNDALSALS